MLDSELSLYVNISDGRDTWTDVAEVPRLRKLAYRSVNPSGARMASSQYRFRPDHGFFENKYIRTWWKDENAYGPKATTLPMDLPFLHSNFRRHLACSLAHLLEGNRIVTFLWGDLLHEVYGGLVALPHVCIEWHLYVAQTDDDRFRNTAMLSPKPTW